jgi:glycosyltransferase involved in cell wall biosynthesis
VKILHIGGSDAGGGSARSAMNLHRSLRAAGVGSRMYVARKHGDDPDVSEIVRHRALQVIERAAGMIVDGVGLQYLFYPSSWWLRADSAFRAADVVQLFNVHGGFFSPHALPWLSRVRPIVWRLSDMWPLTGHCAFSYSCERWRTGCGRCPQLGEYPALSVDTTKVLWHMKGAAYRHSDLTIVAPSRWIAALARESPLMRSLPVHWIPPGVNTDAFSPMDRLEARQQLGLPPEKSIILFVASAVTEHRKGFATLVAGLDLLRRHGVKEPLLVVTGAGRPADDLPLPARWMGRIEDDRSMRRVYAAADVTVLPVLADNLPNTLLESMACGTPVVAFDVGGVSDALRHLETGYLAKASDVGDLVAGITLLLGDAVLRERVGAAAVALIREQFSERRQTQSFLDLYASLAETKISAGRLSDVAFRRRGQW